MPYRDLSFLEIVSDPETEEKLSQLEPWLYSCGDNLYPVICDTAVLQPDVNLFLRNEASNIARAMAEADQRGEVREWYMSRYGFFNMIDPQPMDTHILGEGYPGFLDALDLPEFMAQLNINQPENLVMDIVGEHHYQLGLDLGCGQGGMSQVMANSCRQVFGLEQNFFLAATANRLLRASEIPIRYTVPEVGDKTAILEKKAVDNVQVICGDVNAMPFCEPLFDWVHCGHFLDLIDDPARTVINIQRIMKPGATLSICTPWDFTNEGHFQGMMDIIDSDFTPVHKSDGLPWIRFHHKRKMTVHEDWIWIGKLKK